MNEPLENLYFNWLCGKVINNREINSSSPQLELLRILHSTEFVWLLSGDDNRAEDGKDLRAEFILMADAPDDIEWRTLGCSLLEMLIAFARRAEFNANGQSVKAWFWEFIDNLELRYFNGENIEDKLETLIWRTYKPNGFGGLFPIDDPKSDQREVEIWYQFCDYLVDQDRLP